MLEELVDVELLVVEDEDAGEFEEVELVELSVLPELPDTCGSEFSSELPVDSTGFGLLLELAVVLCGVDELVEEEPGTLSEYPGSSDHGIVDTDISGSPPPNTSDEVELELTMVSGSGRLSVRLPGVNVELTGRCARDGRPNPNVFSVSVTVLSAVETGGSTMLSGIRKSCVPFPLCPLLSSSSGLTIAASSTPTAPITPHVKRYTLQIQSAAII